MQRDQDSRKRLQGKGRNGVLYINVNEVIMVLIRFDNEGR